MATSHGSSAFPADNSGMGLGIVAGSPWDCGRQNFNEVLLSLLTRCCPVSHMPENNYILENTSCMYDLLRYFVL